MSKPVELFTDGACSGNPGPGGWAYILRTNGDESDASGGARRTTNNRMEMRAVIHGLEQLEPGTVVHVYSDSQYLVNGLNEWMAGWKRKGWRRGKNQPVANVDLWKRLDELKSRLEVTAIWVRGHNDHVENEQCDRMAVAACDWAKEYAVEDDLEPQTGLFR